MARSPILLNPGAGRAYPMGRISAVFKADEAETGGTTHDFENRSDEKAGVLNFCSGEFEPAMKGSDGIAEWFRAHPPAHAR